MITKIVAAATSLPAKATPLPQGVQNGIDTIKLWVQVVGGGLAVISLMILGIGLWFASKHEGGEAFMRKAGWWLVGALVFGLAGVIAPIFLGVGN